MPFVAGFERGMLVPLLRPSEVLQLVLTGAVVCAAALNWANGKEMALRLNRVDVCFLAMASAASLLPLLWLALRGLPLRRGDVLACVPLWKYYGLYLLVRASVRNRADAARAAVVSLIAASGVAGIAVCQTLGLFGVEGLLGRFWPVGGAGGEIFDGRGSTTMASPIATAAYLSFNLAVALALWFEVQPKGPRRALLGFAIVALVVGALGTGQVTALVALSVASVVVAYHGRGLTRLAAAGIPVVLLSGVALAPVVRKRLDSIDSSQNLPQSWIVRIDNLQTFYLPNLGGWNWLFGVRPDTIVAAPEIWRSEVFLESGHLWLIYVGGVPLVVAFVAFFVVTLKVTKAAHLAAAMPVDRGLAAASCAMLWAMVLLMALDMHLTFRGGADVLFVFLALALTPFRQMLPWPVRRGTRLAGDVGPGLPTAASAAEMDGQAETLREVRGAQHVADKAGVADLALS